MYPLAEKCEALDRTDLWTVTVDQVYLHFFMECKLHCKETPCCDVYYSGKGFPGAWRVVTQPKL